MQRIVCIGGGPAGLYTAILMRRAMPGARVEVLERNRPDDTFGWGVVLSDATLQNLRSADAESYAAITANFRHWDDIAVHMRGEFFKSGGHGFCGIGRKRLLSILQERARAVGVQMAFQREVAGHDYGDADLIVGADGANSATRNRDAAIYQPDVELRKCRFIWLGTHQKFDAFTFAFELTEHGWFQIHAYQFDESTSTVIVETREETWTAHGLDKAGVDESIAFCEDLFSRYLGGHGLISNAAHQRGSAWLRFPKLVCQKWHHGKIVLIGDAAHTAHFSVGSGTKLAMEDAISLTRHVSGTQTLDAALNDYHAERNVEVLKLQNAARNRMEWFENVAVHAKLPPRQFAYSLLTSSQRIGHGGLAQRDAAYVREYERWLAEQTQAGMTPRPPMFLPFQLKSLKLVNRVVVSPMDQYKAVDGMPGDWHLVHYGSRASGGAGLLVTEMACVSPTGRISPGCPGLWNEGQRDAWARIVKFVHENSPAQICLQLGHSGRKGSTQLGWQRADHPLEQDNWPLLAPSPIPYMVGISQVPRAMHRDDMDEIRNQFVRTAVLAEEAGFDMIELHMAHGYLLASFLSPLTNQREDAYGGSLSSRMRYPLEVLGAVRRAWPEHKPLSVRLSATDWAEGGIDGEEAVEIAKGLKAAGADLIDVSTGQTVPWQSPVYGRMYQTPFADLIRSEVDIATIAVGNIFEPDHVNSIIAAGRADLCALARPHLADAAWTQHAAALQQYDAQWWPAPYLAGKAQLFRNLSRVAPGGS